MSTTFHASFNRSKKLYVRFVVYGTLSNAYNAVTTNGNIEAKAMTFVENLTTDRNVTFTLMGGYSDDFSSRTDFTILNGVLTISSGSMIVDDLIIL